jgi:hypothetical protein
MVEWPKIDFLPNQIQLGRHLKRTEVAWGLVLEVVVLPGGSEDDSNIESQSPYLCKPIGQLGHFVQAILRFALGALNFIHGCEPPTSR